RRCRCLLDPRPPPWPLGGLAGLVHRFLGAPSGGGNARDLPRPAKEGTAYGLCPVLCGERHDGKTNDRRSPARTSATSTRTSSPRAARTIKPALDCISSSVDSILDTSLVPTRPIDSTIRLFASSRSANCAGVRPHASRRTIGST